MFESLIVDIEKNLYPGVPVIEAVQYLQHHGSVCQDVTSSSTWTTIRPRRTFSCTLVVKEPPMAWQIDIVLPEDESGKLIRAVINKHRLGL
jgi:hypothetical protein